MVAIAIFAWPFYQQLRAELIDLIDQVDIVELAANPAFDRAFMEAMKF